MKFYLNSPLNLQINETKKNGKMHLLKTEKERKKFILYQTKTRTGQNLFSSKYKVLKSRKHQTVVHIKILRLPFQEGVSNYLIT